MHDAVQYERQGVPTVTLVHDNFEKAARAQARMLGIADLPMAIISREAYSFASLEEVRKAADALYPKLVESLMQKLKVPAT